MKTRYALGGTVAVSVTAFVGSAAVKAAPPKTVAPNSLSNTQWELVIPDWELGKNARLKAPRLAFTRDRLSASVGCNQMGGGYTLKGNNLKVGPLISTKMSCGPELDRLEGEYGRALQEASQWHLSRNGHILLLQGKNKAYVFHRTQPGDKK